MRIKAINLLSRDARATKIIGRTMYAICIIFKIN